MDQLALAAGTAIVSAMATQSWDQVRTAIVGLWRKAHHGRAEADAIERELDETRAQVLATRGEAGKQSALAGVWQLRLQGMLDARPHLAAEIERLLGECLVPALPPSEQSRIRDIMIKAKGHSRQYIAGGDMHISES